ncbi:signal recognition particle-docking protein FtsY [Actinotignum sanguinis]|uniref:signal recognition particle-docking protein FtsY n=1 Tax=Actinotignum sanguinis TaxID=1445614 RepID=UPI000F7D840D|nr:signal recognition particle-docking protein FtsY [Actinotignum sanguinis]MDY5148619.1 signal recognition particle-docking protein FtsY [Actinotignum sanguinis]RTE51038.1 signal recognition particle-docking protein FtsY [Actinotignum sanguinis]
MDNPVVLALVIAAVAALLLVPLVISLVKKNQRREELERRNIPVLEGDSTAEAQEGADEETTGEIPGEIPGETAPDVVTVPAVEQPESVPSRMQRLRARLARSGGFGQALLAILSRGDLSAADWEELEDTLIMADVGLDATSEIMEGLRSRVKIESTSDPQRVREILREELLRHVGPDMDRSLNLTRSEADSGAVHPAAVLMVGVNGTGKTTTVGKLARLLRAQGTTVLLGAADTFRAAAADQLVTWGDRVGVDVVRSDREGADPASVAFDAVAQADATGVDVVIVDTAGRLQNKAGLMDELGKIKRVMERTAPVNEVLLVLDATTGQNGMQQARVFAEVTGLTGIVLTKLDGTAKGGIVISVQRELGVPVKLVGLGEGPDDLAPFDPEGFVDSLLS